MIAWRVPYCAVWDNDEAGRYSKDRAEAIFGDEVSKRHFFLLPIAKGKNRILQNLFTGNDILMIKQELELPRNSSFEKVIASLFYNARKAEIVGKLSSRLL